MDKSQLHNATPAGFGRRLMAALYDWLLVLAVMMIASVPLVAIDDNAVQPGNLLYQLALVALVAAFFVGFWTREGQTLGMRAWRLKLTQTDGSPVTVSQALLRFLCACVAALPCGLGFAWLLISSKGESWHDTWSGTRIWQLPKQDR
jgi:uncharacterized RDD family membrane protein YckC